MIPDSEEVLEIYCWGHLRNVCLGGMNKELSKLINKILAEELEAIESHLIVSTSIDAVLCAVDKELSLCANYPKGHGELFLWLDLSQSTWIPITSCWSSIRFKTRFICWVGWCNTLEPVLLMWVSWLEATESWRSYFSGKYVHCIIININDCSCKSMLNCASLNLFSQYMVSSKFS